MKKLFILLMLTAFAYVGCEKQCLSGANIRYISVYCQALFSNH